VTAFSVLLFLAVVCVVWAIASFFGISAYLERRGIKTPLLWARALVLRNVSEYRRISKAETGKVGPLFCSYVISISAAGVFMLAALVARGLS